MKVVIIEDEHRSARELQQILKSLDPDITVIATLSAVDTAVKWLQENPAPDLIFSDIQLGDGLSFEIFKTVNCLAPVIFCTAFDQYAIDAFQANSIDYLLKPLEESMVEASLQKFKRIKAHFSTSTYSRNLNNVVNDLTASYKQSILVHLKDKIFPLKVADFTFIYSTNGITSVYLKDKQRFIVSYSIEQLESLLNPLQFFKANRQFIVNRAFVKNVAHYFNRRLVIQTTYPPPTDIIVSRIKVRDFLSWLDD
jgi:DNA-binding LytR/AlgR family response regulator